MKNNQENKSKETRIEKPKFQTSYTYYIFLLCNFIVMLGLTICLIFTKNAIQDFKLPVVICNIIALFVFAVFLYLESRIILPYRFHINHKWYCWFIASSIIFALILIASTVIVCLPVRWAMGWAIGLLCGCVVVSLIVVGIYRYGRFHIDKEIFQRKNGIYAEQEKLEKQKHEQSRQQIDQMSDAEFKKMRDKINSLSSTDYIGKKATSNLVDELDEDEEAK